jgi:hypothetical protein
MNIDSGFQIEEENVDSAVIFSKKVKIKIKRKKRVIKVLQFS